MDVAYSAFLKQVSLELPTSASFDDGPFRVFRHFEFNARKHFFQKDITCWFCSRAQYWKVGFHWACELLGVYRDETCTYIVP